MRGHWNDVAVAQRRKRHVAVIHAVKPVHRVVRTEVTIFSPRT